MAAKKGTALAKAEPVEALNPITGELVDVANATTTDLAAFRDEIRDARDRLSAWARSIDGELVARLDVEAKRSANVGDWKITAGAPKEWRTDEVGLRAALLKLVRKGKLSRAAVDAAVEEVKTVHARRAGLKALHGHADEEVRNTVADYDRYEPVAQRRVSVSRRVER